MAKESLDLAARRSAALPRAIASVHPVSIVRGQGARVWDEAGREYIDFAGGIGALNVGHCHPRVVQAVQEQAEKLTHMCSAVALYEPYVALAERLNSMTPGKFSKKTMLANSGAEAVENAIKIARAATGRQAVVTFTHAFHGRTLLTMSMTAKVDPYKGGFGPFAPEIYRSEYPYCYRCPVGKTYPSCSIACLRSLYEVVDTTVGRDKLAAIVIEPVAGEGGFIPAPPEHLRSVQQLCRDTGAVFIVDEIQTGFGRTGRLFASEHSGIEPDLITTAKSLAAGYPLSAVTGRAELMDAPIPGSLGGTYTGNPVACAAALAVCDIVRDEHLSERAAQLGQVVGQRFASWRQRFPVVGDARGLGAMWGIELITDRRTQEPAPDLVKHIIAHCREQGVLMLSCGTYKNVIRTLMPLVISDAELERALDVLESALAAVA